MLRFDDLQRYLTDRAVHKIPDWSACPLDDEGKALQVRMGKALEVSTSELLSLDLLDYFGVDVTFTRDEDHRER